MRKVLFFLFLTSAFALILAYISQYFFDLQPCALCLYQRIPFFIIIILTLPILLIKKLNKWQKLAIITSITAVFSNALLAFYHIGVENKIFTGFGSCTGTNNDITDLEILKTLINNTKIVRCDKPAFILFGISMAGWNGVYCLGIVSISAFGLKKFK